MEVIYLISGQPRQGKTTISNQFDCPVISLDEVFLQWYNKLTGMEHRYHFSVPTTWQILPQKHIYSLLDAIYAEINSLIESETKEVVIDGWLLFFLKESIKQDYKHIKIIDIVVHTYYAHVNSFRFKNETESEIKENIVEPIKKLAHEG